MTDATEPQVTDRDVYITRSFAAPRAVVWSFWTQPERLAEWFGPAGITTPASRIDVDLRAGGRWDLGMTSDDTGEVFPLSASIVTVVDQEYLEMVVSAQSSIGELEAIILRITFHDHGDTTRMTLHQGPFTPEARDLTADGWKESFIKLDAIFERTAS
jgi:uncharacterized protein YndB with AHSA1/START domain